MPSDSFFDKVITHLVSLYCTLIGLRPFRMQDNKIQFSYIGTIYNILLITFYSFGIILALRNRFRVLLPKETHLTVLVDSFVLTANYLAVVITWYCCAFKQKFLHQLIWAWEDVQQLEKVLKIERFTSTRRNTITRRFLVVSFFWHLLNLVVSFSLTLCGGGKLSNIVKKQWTFWFLYTAVNSVNTALILVLLEIMWELRKSYRSLNRRIMKLTESSTKKLTFNYHIGFVANEPSISDILYLIGKLHRKLAVVAETTMKFARLPLLFSVGVCFGHTFLGIFGVHRYFYMQDSIRIPHSSVICSLFFPLQRMLLCNIVLIMICSLPQWTCDEAIKTSEIIDRCLHRWKNSSDRTAVKKLKLFLLQMQPQVSIFGLFDLDYNLLSRVWISVIMYYIYMIQLDERNLEIVTEDSNSTKTVNNATANSSEF